MRVPVTIPIVVICTLGAAGAWSEPGEPAHASGDAPLKANFALFHNGAPFDDPSLTLVASDEPVTLELLSGHWEKDEDGILAFHALAGAGAWRDPPISMDVHKWFGFNKSYVNPIPPTLVDHGNGTASLTVDRSIPAYGRVRLDVGGAFRTLSVDVLPPLPAAGYGSPDGSPQAPPRIAAQARLPLCADVTHEARMTKTPYGDALSGADLRQGAVMSGVPPIEGTSNQGGRTAVPLGAPGPHPDNPRWDCLTRASYGTQAPQWLMLCDVPGLGRTHHYTKNTHAPGHPAAVELTSPHTGYITTFPKRPDHIYNAGPGPYWDRIRDGRATLDLYGPDAHVPFNAHYPITSDGTATLLQSRVKGTFSSAPELLPFDDLVVIRATAFHADDVTFEVSPRAGVSPPRGGSHAHVNGTSVPVKVGETVRVPVSVSKVAWENGILVRGITDASAAPDSIVRDLHEVTLVAKIPVDAGGGRGYERLGLSESVEPWGCWPRQGGEPMRVGSREAWPAAPREGARMVPFGPAREHVSMGEPIDEHMEDAAAPGASLIDVRAPDGWGEGTAISARLAASSPWPPGGGAAAPRVDTTNRGDGTAVIAIDRSVPGEHVIEITAVGPKGAVAEFHTLRIVPPEPTPPNLAPELVVLLDGEPADAVVDLTTSPEPVALELRATDPEGDPVRFLARASWPPHGARADSAMRLGDRGDGTAVLYLDRSEPGEVVLDMAAADAHGEGWGTWLVRVSPPPGPGVWRGGHWLQPPLVELPTSPKPALLEARADDGGEVSVRALRSAHWGGGEALESPRVEGRRGGAATIVVDASAPGEHLVEVAAAGETMVYVIRVLPTAKSAYTDAQKPVGVLGFTARAR